MRHPMFTHEDGNGFRVLLEQASHEIHRGAYDIGLQYLNKALAVSYFLQCRMCLLCLRCLLCSKVNTFKLMLIEHMS